MPGPTKRQTVMQEPRPLPPALALLSSERPRNVSWWQAGGMLYGDWGTSRLYVLGLAFLIAGRTSFWLILAMSLLILAVGWAYTQICRLYPDGGGVYTAAGRRSKMLGAIGALLLFADYTITASLSAVEAFHYFGLGHRHVATDDTIDAGSSIQLAHEKYTKTRLAELPAGITFPAQPGAGLTFDAGILRFQGEMTPNERKAFLALSDDPLFRQAVEDLYTRSRPEVFFQWNSPALWAIVAILLIGLFNLYGPGHSSGFSVFTAIAMIGITLLVTIAAIPQINFSNLQIGSLFDHNPFDSWRGFVAIVLALSGVEAIANLTGVMKKPVSKTASKAIWLVATEVAVFNLLLMLAMLALFPLSRDAHTEDMMAFLAGSYIGPIGEWAVRIVGGLLLLSATNTAVNGLMSILYVMSRDGELPAILQKLNSFGAPWIGAIVAAVVPAVVLIFANDLETLAHLYAIGIVGAVALDTAVNTLHPRLRKMRRKIMMGALALFLIVVWITLAVTKMHALAFVLVILALGLSTRFFTQRARRRARKPTLLRQAILEQLTPEALGKKRMLLATAGGTQLADAAIQRARNENAALVVCFIREVALNYRVDAESRLTLETDPAADALFTEFLEKGHTAGVPIIPTYDTGVNKAEIIAEHAAVNAVQRVLIGSSRRSALHQLIKGSFQQRLEQLLIPAGIRVDVISPIQAPTPETEEPNED